MPPEKMLISEEINLLWCFLHLIRYPSPHLNTRSEMPSTNPPMCFYVLLSRNQVCALTQFFLFPFCEKRLIRLEGKSMTP